MDEEFQLLDQFVNLSDLEVQLLKQQLGNAQAQSRPEPRTGTGTGAGAGGGAGAGAGLDGDQAWDEILRAHDMLWDVQQQQLNQAARAHAETTADTTEQLRRAEEMVRRAEARAQQAEARAQQAEALARQAEERVLQAEHRAQQQQAEGVMQSRLATNYSDCNRQLQKARAEAERARTESEHARRELAAARERFRAAGLQRGDRGKIPVVQKEIIEGERGGLYYEYTTATGKKKRKYIKAHEVLKCGAGRLAGAGGVCTSEGEKPLFQQAGPRGKRYGRAVKKTTDVNDGVERFISSQRPDFEQRTSERGKKIIRDRFVFDNHDEIGREIYYS